MYPTTSWWTRMAGISLVIAITLLCWSQSLHATGGQPELAITPMRDLQFGDMLRSATVTVGYMDPEAGEFRVEGKPDRAVRILVSSTDLMLNSNEMPLTITNAQCAISLDDGKTWQKFTTGPLFHDTKFPEKKWGKKTASILVRVGGTLRAKNTQQRGGYKGGVTLDVSYISDCDNHGSNNCTYTQGYWKNHEEVWPSDYQTNTRWYRNSSYTWLSLLRTPPRGNPDIILAHQYIAAVLNVADGATSDVDVPLSGGTMTTVQEIIDRCTSHFKGITLLSETRRLEYASILDSYNNGVIGPGHCDD